MAHFVSTAVKRVSLGAFAVRPFRRQDAVPPAAASGVSSPPLRRRHPLIAPDLAGEAPRRRRALRWRRTCIQTTTASPPSAALTAPPLRRPFCRCCYWPGRAACSGRARWRSRYQALCRCLEDRLGALRRHEATLCEDRRRHRRGDHVRRAGRCQKPDRPAGAAHRDRQARQSRPGWMPPASG